MNNPEMKKPVAAYLELLEQQDNLKMTEEYWWTKLDQDQML